MEKDRRSHLYFLHIKQKIENYDLSTNVGIKLSASKIHFDAKSFNALNKEMYEVCS